MRNIFFLKKHRIQKELKRQSWGEGGRIKEGCEEREEKNFLLSCMLQPSHIQLLVPGNST